MGSGRYKFSNSDAPCPVVPDIVGNWGKRDLGLNCRPARFTSVLANTFASNSITSLLAGRVHPMFIGGSGAASSHQEVVARV